MSLMKNTMGELLLSALVKEDVASFVKKGDMKHLLFGTEQNKYKWIQAFVKEYGKLPSPETLMSELQIKLPETAEPASYYVDICKKRYVEEEMKRAGAEATQILQGPALKDPIKAFEHMLSILHAVKIGMDHDYLQDFRKTEVIEGYLQAAWAGDIVGVEMGWPYMDEMSGGLVGGDVVSVVARPGRGKTWLLLWSALHAWRSGWTPLFVSMEMDLLLLQMRLAGLVASIEPKKLKTGWIDPKEKERLAKHLARVSNAENPFWLADGNLTSTVSDVAMYAAQLQPDIIFIDGAYLLSHEDKRLNKYQRVDANCELIKKSLAAKLRLPVVASFQFNRDADKKIKKKDKDGNQKEEVGLEDIAHSDAIGQISSLVLALFEEETPETLHQRRVDVLKGRSGEKGVFRCAWDFKKVDFSQVDPVVGEVKGESARNEMDYTG
jgi:replicative DNA helicase